MKYLLLLVYIHLSPLEAHTFWTGFQQLDSSLISHDIVIPFIKDSLLCSSVFTLFSAAQLILSNQMNLCIEYNSWISTFLAFALIWKCHPSTTMTGMATHCCWPQVVEMLYGCHWHQLPIRDQGRVSSPVTELKSKRPRPSSLATFVTSSSCHAKMTGNHSLTCFFFSLWLWI